MKKAWMFALLILLVACGQKEQKSSNGDEIEEGTTVQSTVEVSESTESTKEEKVLQELFADTRDLGLAWGEALNQHDFETLSELYADTVDLYGDTLDRATILQQKQEKITDFPTFSQQTFYWRGESQTATIPPKEITVKMGVREYWPPDSSFSNVDLVFRDTPEGWKIVSESDIKTQIDRFVYPRSVVMWEGTYCLKWRVGYQAEEEEEEPRIRYREMQVEFTLEGRKVVGGWVSIADEYLEVNEKWKITGGQYNRWNSLEMELQPWDAPLEAGEDPPILRLKTRDGKKFLSDSPTVGFMVPVVLLEKVACK